MITTTLQNVCSDIIDCPHSTPTWVDKGVPAVRNFNLVDGFIEQTNLSYVTEEEYYERIKRGCPEKDDIIISREAPIGNLGIIPDDFKCCLGQRVVLLKVNKSLCDPHFLLNILKTKEYQSKMNNLGGSGTTVSNLRIPYLKNLEIVMPELNLQKKIAKVICSLDDKIRSNRKINDYLTQQKQLAFKTLMNSIDDTNVVKLESVATLQKKTWKPSEESEILEHYSIPAFDEKKYPSFDESTTIQSNKTIVTSDCILVSKLNPETKRVWRPICITDKAVCSTEFLAIIPKDKNYAQYIFGQIDSDGFTEYLINNATGSTGSRQRVLPGTAMLYELPWPEQSEIESYSDRAQSIDSKIRSNMLENEKLIELRDYLLPKLMSGEIDVSKLELDN